LHEEKYPKSEEKSAIDLARKRSRTNLEVKGIEPWRCEGEIGKLLND
jgi:hypothetical protein